MNSKDGIIVPRTAVRTGLIVLAVAAVAGLAQQAPAMWRYAKMEGM